MRRARERNPREKDTKGGKQRQQCERVEAIRQQEGERPPKRREERGGRERERGEWKEEHEGVRSLFSVSHLSHSFPLSLSLSLSLSAPLPLPHSTMLSLSARQLRAAAPAARALSTSAAVREKVGARSGSERTIAKYEWGRGASLSSDPKCRVRVCVHVCVCVCVCVRVCSPFV